MENKPTLLILQGLPASGKSTYAKELVKKGWKRVNRDLLREMIDDSKYSKSNEQHVKNLQKRFIEYFLYANYNVVVDDCNFGNNFSSYKAKFENFGAITGEKVNVELKVIDTPVEECIKRDAKRERSVGKDVILRMYYDHMCPRPHPQNTGKPKCIIVDMDGTLCTKGNRGHYEWDQVIYDHPNWHIIETVNSLASNLPCEVVVVTGRDGNPECQKQSKNWLANYKVQVDRFYIRKEGDSRKDYIIKKEIYDNYIKDNFDVQVVFDDRPQVVRMWKQLGLPVFNVGNEYDF